MRRYVIADLLPGGPVLCHPDRRGGRLSAFDALGMIVGNLRRFLRRPQRLLQRLCVPAAGRYAHGGTVAITVIRLRIGFLQPPVKPPAVSARSMPSDTYSKMRVSSTLCSDWQKRYHRSIVCPQNTMTCSGKTKGSMRIHFRSIMAFPDIPVMRRIPEHRFFQRDFAR